MDDRKWRILKGYSRLYTILSFDKENHNEGICIQEKEC